MFSVNEAPDAILQQDNLSGNLAAIANDDTTWLTAISNNANSILVLSFPTPVGHPVGTQTFRFKYRVTANATSIKFDVYVRDNGTRLNNGNAIDTFNSASTTSVTRDSTWDASLLLEITGSTVEIEIVATTSGGSPSKRTAGEFQFVQWIANVNEPAIPIVTNGAFSTGSLSSPTLSAKYTLNSNSLFSGVAIQGTDFGALPVVPDNLYSITTKQGVDVTGVEWPLTLTYVTGSNGDYRAILPHDLGISPNVDYTAKVTVVNGSNQSVSFKTIRAVVRD